MDAGSVDVVTALDLVTRAGAAASGTGESGTLLPGHRAVGELSLTSFRYLAHPPQRFKPRALRKLALARGLMVYEGLR